MPRKPDRKPAEARPDPLDEAGVAHVDHKDADLLRKFLSDRGGIRSRRVRRVLAQQRRLARAVKNAREMALLPCNAAR